MDPGQWLSMPVPAVHADRAQLIWLPGVSAGSVGEQSESETRINECNQTEETVLKLPIRERQEGGLSSVKSSVELRSLSASCLFSGRTAPENFDCL